MKKKIGITLFLLLLTIVLWIINFQYPDFYSYIIFNMFLTVFNFIIIYIFFKIFLEEILLERIQQAKMKYSFQKIISILYILVFILVILVIWVDRTDILLVSYGIVGAGIAVSLQDVFKNFVGGLLIFSNSIYQVGDRIEIESKIGDIIDISVFYTTVMEVGEWVEGDQATGRITLIPNSYVITYMVNNFTKDHDFLWDEISLPITYDSNWKKAHDVILDILSKETKKIAKLADVQITQLGERYYLPNKPVDPVVYMSLTDNWISFNIRYVTVTRERRAFRDKLSRLILSEFEQFADIEISSETMSISLSKSKPLST